MEKKVELRLPATDETLKDVQNTMETLLRKNGCPETHIMPILIAAEEIFINIAHYAYEGKAGEAVVVIEVTPNNFKATFRDRGMPYNPLAKEDPDITLSAQERKIGGLGVFMVKESMDKVNYEYKDGWNIFTMEKKF